jgi:hypothetical protein
MGVFMFGAFASCDRTVSVDKMPNKAKQFIAANFNGVNVLSVQKDGFKYDVVLFDGTSLEFKSNGQWIEVDCGMRPLPAGVLLPTTAQYLSAQFPVNFPTHVKYEHKRYEVEMDNDLDLVFDKNGVFMGADD